MNKFPYQRLAIVSLLLVCLTCDNSLDQGGRRPYTDGSNYYLSTSSPGPTKGEDGTLSESTIDGLCSPHLKDALRKLKNGEEVDFNEPDEDGKTLLHLAWEERSFMDRADVVKYLAKKGANPDVTNADGQTVLMLASQSSDLQGEEVVKILLDHNADANKKNREGNTALMLAIQESCVYGIRKRMTDPLLAKTQEIDAQNDEGNTAMMLAISKGSKDSEDLAAKLLKRGADPNKQDIEGNTALIIATQKGQKGLVDKLLKKNANPNQQNEEGDTALAVHIRKNCYSNDFIPVLRKLVQVTDLNLVNNHKEHPLHLALQLGNSQMRQVFNIIIQKMKETWKDDLRTEKKTELLASLRTQLPNSIARVSRAHYEKALSELEGTLEEDLT